jgi:hypothetical protein
VDGLRDGGYVGASLVAEKDAQNVGHILCSDLPVVLEAGKIPALALAPLAEAGIDVFAISTFDTDYLLVKAEDLERSVDILRGCGHTIQWVRKIRKRRDQHHEPEDQGLIRLRLTVLLSCGVSAARSHPGEGCRD